VLVGTTSAISTTARNERRRVIALYPQVKKTDGLFNDNPQGCWDWWGYTGAGWYDTRGIRLRAIVAMVNRLKLPSPE